MNRNTFNKMLLLFSFIFLISLLSPLQCLKFHNSTIRFNFSSTAYAADPSDVNMDGVVDLEDVKVFSQKFLKQDWQAVDWCQWLESGPKKEKKHLGAALRDFIIEYFQCGAPPPEDPLAVKNSNIYPTKLCYGPDGKLYVSDAKVGSVFIYDDQLSLIGELKGLSLPLGVAVDSVGTIYVGSNGSDNVAAYSPAGQKQAVIGAGTLQMPNDLALDRDDRLYVVDSKLSTVFIYNSDGTSAGSIGGPGDGIGQLNFPVGITVAYRPDGSGPEVGEVYVADQGHFMVQVFDLQGNFLRSFGSQVSQGMMGVKWQGKFGKIQGLAMDSQGRLHAADCYLNKVQILNADSGAYISYYGTYGPDPGQLRLPLDIAISADGQVAVTNSENQRVEIIYTIQ